nr:SH3 domain-containing protein [Prauserella isguenensis]
MSSEAEGSNGEGGCSMTVDADVLNVRSGPSTGDEVVGTLEQGAETDATTDVRDGFRKLADGEWASDDFLEPVDGASC